MPTGIIHQTVLRQFFMGVLGWTPKTVMEEASIYDLKDAYDGFFIFKNKPSQSTDHTLSENLTHFMQMFPDITHTEGQQHVD